MTASRAPIDPALVASDEPQRLAAVRRYDILDTPPDGTFDRITALAARHFAVPISIVSIVDEDRIWFKSRHGVEAEQVNRDPGLCASAILQDEAWLVEDAATDPRTLANPLVAGELGLRFYAGIPLTTSDGYRLGTLCLIDRRPRRITAEETATLRDLAAIVMDELELRLSARRTIDREQALREQAEQLAHALQESLAPPVLPEIAGLDLAVRNRPVDVSEVGGDFYDVFESSVPDCWQVCIGDVSGKGVQAARVTALARYTIRTAALWKPTPSAVLGILNAALVGQCGSAETFVTAVLATLARAADGWRATISCAGHEPVAVVRAEGEVELVHPEGVLLGAFPDVALDDITLHLGAGDQLVLWTDGVSEARGQGERFGHERIVATLAGCHAADAAGTAARLECAVERFTRGCFDDDTAVLVLAVAGSGAGRS